MHDKRLMNVRLFFLDMLLWVCSVTLLFLSKDTIERVTGPTNEKNSLDLAFVLIAYLLLFLLRPISTWISQRLRNHAQRSGPRHRP